MLCDERSSGTASGCSPGRTPRMICVAGSPCCIVSSTRSPDVSDAGLLDDLQGWLGPELDALATGTPARRIDLAPALRRLLPWPAATELDSLVPERLEVPSGSRVRIAIRRWTIRPRNPWSP